jgi:hypothetical protein
MHASTLHRSKTHVNKSYDPTEDPIGGLIPFIGRRMQDWMQKNLDLDLGYCSSL